MGDKMRRTSTWNMLVQTCAIVVAAPFLVGSARLGFDLVHLPNSAGHFAMARILGGALFAFGLALGLIGATLALGAASSYVRMLGTALTLFGCSHVVLGFVVRRAIENSVVSQPTSLLPLALPVAMWACSVWLAIKAPGTESPSPQPSPAEGRGSAGAESPSHQPSPAEGRGNLGTESSSPQHSPAGGRGSGD